MNDAELPFTYELHEDFRIFPTFACTLTKLDILKALTSCPGLPSFNPMMLLHGEQRFESYRALVPDSKYITVGSIADVSDKGKGMLITIQLLSYEVDDENKKVCFFIRINSF